MEKKIIAKADIMQQLGLHQGAPVHVVYEKVLYFTQRKYRLSHWQAITKYKYTKYYAVYYGLLIDALLFFNCLNWLEITDLMGGINESIYDKYTRIMNKEE